MRTDAPLADALPFAANFMIAVLKESELASQQSLSWVEINRLAAQWLRPQDGAANADTSRIGHAVIVEMARHQMLEAELTTAANGAVMAHEIFYPPSALAA